MKNHSLEAEREKTIEQKIITKRTVCHLRHIMALEELESKFGWSGRRPNSENFADVTDHLPVHARSGGGGITVYTNTYQQQAPSIFLASAAQ